MTAAARIADLRDALRHWAELAGRPLALMEVCGTHTVAIYRHGVHSLLPANVKLISGPGCPVCVTSQGQIDLIVELAARPDVTIATFGDMMRVPGSKSSLERERARGADIRVVYSAHDAVALAEALPARQVVFVGVGFETTAPTIAAAVVEARRRQVRNFSLLPFGKLIPPALDALLRTGELRLDGLICPGHVSVIIGSDAYKPLASDYGVPCVVAGFEPSEILDGIVALVRRAAERRAEVENCYATWVRPQGNRRAQEAIYTVFDPGGARWRGLGTIKKSGLCIRDEWSEYDAIRRFGLEEKDAPEPDGCRCGDVLCGRLRPAECPLFARLCTTENPVGPCMVSTEGSCAATYRYGRL